MNKSILIIDDAEVNRAILSNIFSDEYHILEASDGASALQILQTYREEICIILLDLHMPGMNGFEVMDECKKKNYLSTIPVILITGDDSYDSERVGYEYGVADIIRKPFNSKIVYTRINNIIELYQHKNKLEELVKEQTKKLRHMNNHIIDMLSTVVEFRNLESGGHIKRIRSFTEIMLRCIMKFYPEYELTEDLIDTISSASAMHDIGKIAIQDNILLKPGRLTTDEFEIMKTHTTKGCDIIDMVASIQGEEEFFNYCYEICRYHHERYDGNGYPDGISGDDIPIAAQAVAVADVYDALVSERVYKEAYSKEKAYQMIMDGECGVFSPKIMECFQFVREEFENLVDLNKESN